MSINKKLNFGGNMNNFADQKIAAAMQMAGKILPAEVVSQSGKMVTVTFLLRDIPYTLPQLTIPLRDIFLNQVKGLVSSNLVSMIDIQVGINGKIVPPAADSSLVYGDTYAYFSTSSSQIQVKQYGSSS
ncbi:hypothetical protein DB992_12020 [Salmonella enterica]|nr:hypothetical protein [Salmonella enterica]EBN4821765.1 hypothetical protein [Salmonella enterica]MDJ4949185.1 hypothetical protein [Salmonella enterica]